MIAVGTRVQRDMQAVSGTYMIAGTIQKCIRRPWIEGDVGKSEKVQNIIQNVTPVSPHQL